MGTIDDKFKVGDFLNKTVREIIDMDFKPLPDSIQFLEKWEKERARVMLTFPLDYYSYKDRFKLFLLNFEEKFPIVYNFLRIPKIRYN